MEKQIKVTPAADGVFGGIARTAVGIGVFAAWAVPTVIFFGRSRIDSSKWSHLAALATGALTSVGAARIIKGSGAPQVAVVDIDEAAAQ